MRRTTSFKIIKPESLNTEWKPVKSKRPDVGTYEPAKCVSQTKERHPSIGFTRSKSVKFTTEYSNNKKHIPGSGMYKIQPCFDSISRPYMKKRF